MEIVVPLEEYCGYETLEDFSKMEDLKILSLPYLEMETENYKETLSEKNKKFTKISIEKIKEYIDFKLEKYMESEIRYQALSNLEFIFSVENYYYSDLEEIEDEHFICLLNEDKYFFDFYTYRVFELKKNKLIEINKDIYDCLKELNTSKEKINKLAIITDRKTYMEYYKTVIKSIGNLKYKNRETLNNQIKERLINNIPDINDYNDQCFETFCEDDFLDYIKKTSSLREYYGFIHKN